MQKLIYYVSRCTCNIVDYVLIDIPFYFIIKIYIFESYYRNTIAIVLDHYYYLTYPNNNYNSTYWICIKTIYIYKDMWGKDASGRS